MTNDPLDDAERKVWENSYVEDERFKAALRLDRGFKFVGRKLYGYKKTRL